MAKHKMSLILCVVLLAGCGSLSPHRAPQRLDRVQDCQAFLHLLDKKVKQAGVQDASSFPVPGFPHLRTNRFLAALKAYAISDPEKQQWMELMYDLGQKSRRREILNLPEGAIPAQGTKQAVLRDRTALFERMQSCCHQLLEHDRFRAGLFDMLYPLVAVPDEYSTPMRIAGLYSLVSVPVNFVSERARRKFRTIYKTKLEDLPVEGELKAFVPGEIVHLPQAAIRDRLMRASRNPLQIPIMEGNEEHELAAALAPVVVQDVAAPYDWPGRVMRLGSSFVTDHNKRTLYYYTTHALLHGQPILQMNYVAWYSQRAGKRSPPIERGKWDGLTVRISLDTQGSVFMVDVMNNCGCYHFFVPRKERVLRVVKKRFALDPFVPQWLPNIPPEKRLALRVNSGWHQVERLYAQDNNAQAIAYELLPYELLQSFPDENGRHMSLFDSRGLIADSNRVEPYILFSMGIPSIGSMRQRGHHAIELTGRQHFDDPYLFDKNFVIR